MRNKGLTNKNLKIFSLSKFFGECVHSYFGLWLLSVKLNRLLKMMNSHSQTARTHEENRKVVCCVCGKKPKSYGSKKPISVVSPKQEELVRKFVFKDYNVDNSDFPTGLCLPCNTTLLAFEKVVYIFFELF